VTGDPYRVAFLDWLACAVGGRDEPAARAAAALGDGVAERVAAAGTAGHVLDFDDTHATSLVHLSATCAPAALLVDAWATVADVLAAYQEAIAAEGWLASQTGLRLRARGWHPTAVCGVAGAAVAAACVLHLDDEQHEHAVRLALLRAGGLQAAFGSDGKALQVGLAAAAGVTAARLAAAGATASDEVYSGFDDAFGVPWPDDVLDPPDPGWAIAENWIKAYPCCLQTHSAIEAAARAGGVPDGLVEVVVHPLALQTAWRIYVATGLEAKFSIPYLTAYTLLHGEPRVESFATVDADASAFASRISVRTDESLGLSEARLVADGKELARVEAALGSPERPMDERALAAKVSSLAGDRLDGALDDPHRPARELLDVLAS
jgi:2-methylcitrate dehydratase PrpD